MALFDFFKKKDKKKNTKDKKSVKVGKKKDKKEVISQGKYTLKDMMAPQMIDRSNPDYLIVDDKYIRNFVLTGYPPFVSTKWLDDLYNYDGDMDVALYIEPADRRRAQEELTAEITKVETQILREEENGRNTYITKLVAERDELYRQRAMLEQNIETLFQIQILANLYANSLDELDKTSKELQNRLRGKRMTILPSYLQQDEGYKSTLPFGKMYGSRRYRNFNTGALSTTFPFYNSEISHENGVFFGVNLETGTQIYLDFYDRDILNNSNFSVFGTSGSGKSYALSTISMRSTYHGIQTVIIDPEGEYVPLTKALGGEHMYISPNSETRLNPFDLEEEDETDDDGIPTGRKVLNVREKVADVLNLIAVMGGGLTRDQESLCATIIADLYRERGFTDDPNSLYETEPTFDRETGNFYAGGVKKPMPTFSDFHDKLAAYAEKENKENLKVLVDGLRMFRKEEVYGMFDCQTNISLDFDKVPIVVFDVSQLEESILRPIGMYIAMTWTWEKFIKKNPEQKKRLILDEAWMLVDRNMAGSEYTAAFLEKAARRIRKNNGGLVIASQDFKKFTESGEGHAVLINSSAFLLLKQNRNHIDAVGQAFNLSQGEMNFLASARRGEMLLKLENETTIAELLAYKHEHELIGKKEVVNKNLQKKKEEKKETKKEK